LFCFYGNDSSKNEKPILQRADVMCSC